MARDFSATGFSFLSDGFLHKSTQCHLKIITLDGSWLDVDGSVARCRYVSNRVHEIGVAFSSPIDVSRVLQDKLSASVLLVDDSPDFANLTSRLLLKRGLEVLLAKDGRQAIEAATGTEFDVIMIDVNMPGIRGPEVIRELRRRGVRAAVIAMSADDSSTIRTECQAAGANRFLSKPFRPQALADAIKSELSAGMIYSELSNDPEMDRFVADFVASLPKRLEELRTAQRAHDQQRILDLARELKTIASTDGGYGFPAIGNMAQRLEQLTAGDATDWKRVEHHMGEIVELVGRVRVRTGK